MKAIIRAEGGLTQAEVDDPICVQGKDVLIKIAYVGICRTDIRVANGGIRVEEPRIIGHELSGIIVAQGSLVGGFQIGDRVVAHPEQACGKCHFCVQGECCQQPLMIGLHRDGAFAEYIKLSVDMLYLLPESVSMLHGAFVEPLAAASAVNNLIFDRQARACIYGDNRIGKLVKLFLDPHFDRPVDLLEVGELIGHSHPMTGSYDLVVDADLSELNVRAMVHLLKLKGCLVLRSRTFNKVPLDVGEITRKELSIRSVNYGSFPESIGLLASGRLCIDEFLGENYPLSSYADALDSAAVSDQKVFLCVDDAIQ
tara:strand:- start:1273 stop:2208 length:936 start_codon:yes stop_codon:yes gene_type:complete